MTTNWERNYPKIRCEFNSESSLNKHVEVNRLALRKSTVTRGGKTLEFGCADLASCPALSYAQIRGGKINFHSDEIHKHSGRKGEKQDECQPERKPIRSRGRPRKTAPDPELQRRPRRSVSMTKLDQSASWLEEEEVKKAIRASISTDRRANNKRTTAASTSIPHNGNNSDQNNILSESDSDYSDSSMPDDYEEFQVGSVPCTEDFLDYLATRNSSHMNPKLAYFDDLLKSLQPTIQLKPVSSMLHRPTMMSSPSKSPLAKANLQRAKDVVNAAKSYVSPKKFRYDIPTNKSVND